MVASIPTVTITPTGISAPSYADKLAAGQAILQSIYGSDSVLTPDSQDGQMLAIFIQASYDADQGCVATYNSFSPATAQGAGLSSVVKINGIQREAATASTANVTITGVANTPINNGIVGDNLSLGTQWALPSLVTIPLGGSITVTATCTVAGATLASAGTLTKILTPTAGWQSVTNAGAAAPGNPVESDAALRQRQSQSTAGPAQTPLESIFAAVANVAGVGRLQIYENDTDSASSIGIPGHSIAAVVGGTPTAANVAAAIAAKKSPGTGTFGTTTVTVIDQNGVPDAINFFVLSLVTISVTVTIKALNGFVSTTSALIQQAVAAFIVGLDIGEYSFQSRLNAPAALSGDAATVATGQTQAALDALAATYQVRSITQSRAANPVDTTVTGGPYIAGVTAIQVVSAVDIYAGSQVTFTLDNAAAFTAFVSSVVGSTINLLSGVPAGRNVPNGSNVFLASDVKIAFNEAATCVVANVTVTVT